MCAITEFIYLFKKYNYQIYNDTYIIKDIYT